MREIDTLASVPLTRPEERYPGSAPQVDPGRRYAARPGWARGIPERVS
ncbi:MAG: hypothetical protein IPH27_05445 [Actinomycetales bacterium]|nr:hypothetical protein [Candidatus Phosphoribacter baldrii]